MDTWTQSQKMINKLNLKTVPELMSTLDITPQQAELLQIRFHNLIALRDTDMSEVSANTGIPKEKLEHAQTLAMEYLKDGTTFKQESDKANFEKVLQDLNIPFEKLKQAGVESFSDARRNLTGLKKVGLDRNQLNKLAACTRLSVVAPDMSLNQKLITAGITRVTGLATADLNKLAQRTGIEKSLLAKIKKRAQVYQHILLANLTESKVGFSDQKKLKPSQDIIIRTEPDNSDNPDLSALSPAAYLIDLIQFIKDSFPAKFPDLNSFERRFYRQFKDFPITFDTTKAKVHQIEIINRVLESFIQPKWQKLSEAYLKAYPPVDRGPLDTLLKKLKTSEAELKTALEILHKMAQHKITLTVIEQALEALNTQERTQGSLDHILLLLGISQESLESALKLIKKMNSLKITTKVVEDAFRAAYPPPGDRHNLDQVLQQLSLPETDLDDVIGPYKEYRDQLYASFSGPGFGYPNPGIIAKLVDSLLNNLGISRQDIAVAFFSLPYRAKMDSLLKPRYLTEEDLTNAFGLTQTELSRLDQVKLTVHQAEGVLDLIRKAKTKGQYPDSPHDSASLEVYQRQLNQAETIISWAKEYTLAETRDNLIYIALKLHKDFASSPSLENTGSLGNYLYSDLLADAIIKTTQVENMVETLQSFIEAFRLGKEKEVVLQLSRDNFEDRWRWLQSYSIWQAAQMMFLYPENFMLPYVRRNRTPQFQVFVDKLPSGQSALQREIDGYAGQFFNRNFWINESNFFVTLLNNRIFIIISHTGAIDIIEQMQQGEWSRWKTVANLPGERLTGAIGFNDQLYLFFRRNVAPLDAFDYIVLDPDADDPSPELLITDTLGFPIPNAIALVAGRDYLSIYFCISNQLARLQTNRFHKWKVDTQNGCIDDRFLNAIALSTVGSMDGYDYLLCADNQNKLWLVKVKTPPVVYLGDMNPGWTFLRNINPAVSDHVYIGSIVEGRLWILAYQDYNNYMFVNFTPEDVTKNPVRCTQFRSFVSTIDVKPSGGMVGGENVLLLYGPDTYYQSGIVHYLAFTCKSIANWGIEVENFEFAHGSIYVSVRDGLRLRHPLKGTESSLEAFKTEQANLMAQVGAGDLNRLIYDEWFLYIPLLVAQSLRDAQRYQDAANWLHVLYYPFRQNPQERLIYYGFNRSGDADYDFRNNIEWLRDPFNPYLIARTRKDAIKYHVIYQYVENLLDWADAEYVCNTGESIAHARSLYELAGEILKNEVPLFDLENDPTGGDTNKLDSVVYSYSLSGVSQKIPLIEKKGLETREDLLTGSIDEVAAHGWDTVIVSPEVTLQDRFPGKIGDGGFYLPVNPLLESFRRRIIANLKKIRTGCSFAGTSSSNEESIPGEPPPVYRFSYLIERARYYVSVAQQLESLLLQSYKEYDAEQYNLLRAKQDLKISRANIALQDLRIKEADDSIALAGLQTKRAELQRDQFQSLINKPLSDLEKEVLSQLENSKNVAIQLSQTPADKADLVNVTQFSFSGYFTIPIEINSTNASFERRLQEWNLQRDLAQKDIYISQQGETLANGHKNIVQQELNIAHLQQDLATEVVNFLETKFTSKELWEWMARVVKRYYRDNLDVATQTARMAQQALAFERQVVLAFIAPYYGETAKQDLLVAEQLLNDINKLDQHRLTTEKRRKELTKVISLASCAPVEFLQLRQQGRMTFTTLMDWFDRDFPGHYLRLIKNVSLTVVGLIPPGESIHATLSNNGLSQVMVGPPWHQLNVIRRQPESIAVTTASNGTGLFEMRLDDPMLLPFEGSGIQATWTLELPKGANHFDFNNLVDIYLTIRYTALDDPGYRWNVLQQMGADLEGHVPVQNMKSFSLHSTYPDQWYHLLNPVFKPNAIGPVYTIEFKISKPDYPPNEDVKRITRLILGLQQVRSFKVPLEIEYIPDGQAVGNENHYVVRKDYYWDKAQDMGGPISLVSFDEKVNSNIDLPGESNPSISSLSPYGTWQIKIRTDVKPTDYPELFQNAKTVDNQIRLDLSWLTDMLFVVNYDAEVEYGYAE
jgi:hypothetical protein